MWWWCHLLPWLCTVCKIVVQHCKNKEAKASLCCSLLFSSFLWPIFFFILLNKHWLAINPAKKSRGFSKSSVSGFCVDVFCSFLISETYSKWKYQQATFTLVKPMSTYSANEGLSASSSISDLTCSRSVPTCGSLAAGSLISSICSFSPCNLQNAEWGSCSELLLKTAVLSRRC